jgi:glucosylceramidase
VPLTSRRPVWESEWANFGPWDPAWDDGTAGSGMTWAQDIQNALTQAGVDGFFYWWGASASTANSGLIQVAGSNVNLSKRYWAFAAFSRYIRPGAARVAAHSADSNVSVSAFRNRDNSIVVEAINTANTAQPVGLQVSGRADPGHAAAYLTDATSSLSPETPAAATQAPPRSLTTWVIPAP